jgi:uncharacterized protein YlzI (FlbEa/FlbD family)
LERDDSRITFVNAVFSDRSEPEPDLVISLKKGKKLVTFAAFSGLDATKIV